MKQDLKKLFYAEYLFLFLFLAAILIAILRSVATQNKGVERGDFQTIILYGNDDKNDLRILEDRLANSIHKEAYELTEREHFLELKINPYAINNCDVGDYLEMFLTEPQEYSIVYQKEEDSAYRFHTLYGPDELGRIEVETGKMDEIVEEPTDIQTKSDKKNEATSEEVVPRLTFRDGEKRFMRFSFDGEVIAEIRKHLAVGNSVYMKKRSSYDGYETNNLLLERWSLEEEDGSGGFLNFYDSADTEYGNEEALKYCLTHEKLKKPYNYLCVEDVNWNKVEETSLKGKFLKNVEDIENDSYLIVFDKGFSGKRLTMKEVQSVETTLCERLDSFEMPYAMGTTVSGGIGIKISPEHINRGILSALISDKGPCLKVWDQRYPLNWHAYRMENGGKTIRIVLDESTLESIKDDIDGCGKERESIFLMFGELPVAKAEIQVPIFENELVFENFCYSNPQKQEYGSEWITALIGNLCENPKMPVSLEQNYICFREEYYNDDSYFGQGVPDICSTEEIEAKIKAICPEAEVELSSNYIHLNIWLHLPMDDQIIAEIFEKCPQIYKTVCFEDSYYSNLTIYPYDTEGDERARLDFSKEKDYSSNKRSVVFSGTIFDGRIEKHKEELERCIEEDTFFSGFDEDYFGERWTR